MNATAPVLIAYDGSDAARRAIHKTAELLGSRRALVLTVWKPGLSTDEITATRGGTQISAPSQVDLKGQRRSTTLFKLRRSASQRRGLSWRSRLDLKPRHSPWSTRAPWPRRLSRRPASEMWLPSSLAQGD